MIIKRYIVKNMNEAMTRIRYELGKDAIIISQRKIRQTGIKGFFSPKLIEVTAALENNKVNRKEEAIENSLKESVESIKSILKKDEEQKIEKKPENNLETEVKEMKSILNKILKNTNADEEDSLITLINKLDLNTEYMKEFIQVWDEAEDKENALMDYLAKDIKVCNSDIKGKVVLIGPTGVGKTTTIAKLAGKLALVDNKKVGLITIDTYRIGAVDQLRTYAEIMNLPFKVVITIKEMEEAINSMSHLDVVLIDTTGRSSKNNMQISELRAFVQKANPDDIILVMSGITKNKDAKLILNGYEKLNYNKLIITKLDETSSYGILHTVINESKKPIAYITTGQNVPEDIKVPKKEDIINLIMGEDSI
ncbi:MAG: flagellar biosynthesis protein FlhF [Clostridium sp.]|nr:flagellar biosynthesis protein FlhF [Clostridium sp.]